MPMSQGRKVWETIKSMKKLLVAHVFVGTTASGAIFLSNTYFTDKWRSVYECLDSGFPSPLSKELNECFTEVLNDMKIADEERDKIKPFKIPRLGMYHIGYPKYDILIGIPWYFEYKDPYEAVRPAACWGTAMDWYTPEGVKHRETMVLSKNEKKFALAREISEARSMHNYKFPIVPLGVSTLSFAFLYYLESSFIKLDQLTKWKKRGLGFLFYSITVLFYIAMKDSINLSMEYDADIEVSNIGLENDKPTDLTLDYIKGGIEYYNKMLIRNKIIKDLYLPMYIKWIVTDEGDLSQYFRKKHASILVRKKELEAMLVNFEKYGKLHLRHIPLDQRNEKMKEESEKIFGIYGKRDNAWERQIKFSF